MPRDIDDRLQDLHDLQEGRTGETGGEVMQVPINMYEAGEALVVVAPLPGVMPSDITVDVAGGELRIAAGMRSPAAKQYLTHEWHYGPFERTVTLPEGYGGQGTATLGHGQLAIRVLRGGDGGPVPVKLA